MALEGSFAGPRKHPFIRARLLIRRLGIDSKLDFLIDTGADRSMLLHGDARRLRLNYSSLSNVITTGGIGGVASAYLEHAILVFEDIGDRRIHVYRLELVVAQPQSAPVRLPSLLGRDILNHWHMAYRPTENRLRFDVVDADETIELL